MSELKLISPLLDGFILGNPMSDHHGVRCCPAMKEATKEKYIVKIISVPASQVQLDALLLTGAYKDPADAMDYFKEVAESIVTEAEFLKKVGKLEGFLSYDSWQIVPKENGGLGYEVYLLGTYKRSLERYMRRNPITHLEAVNLGLDMCAALAICRRAGYMYVDLKPTNIFISKEKEYRIGDLGFVRLDSLKYLSLPGKYRSPYSPPETQDDLKILNETVDTYAAGMILYQVYNDGNLPKATKNPLEVYPSPINADYEIAEIIMKAIAPLPENRWQNPMEMGQALVGYLQRNNINNTPIVSPAVVLTAADKRLEVEEPAAKEPAVVEPADQPAPIQQDMVLEAEHPEEPSVPPVEIPEECTVEETPAEEMAKEPVAVAAAVQVDHARSEDPIIPVTPVARKTADFSPAPVVKVVAEDDFDLDAFLSADFMVDSEEIDDDPSYEEELLPDPEPEHNAKKFGWLIWVIVLVVLALIGAGGFYFYQNYYLQTIHDMTVSGTQEQLVVTIDADVKDSLLYVSCTDAYGNGVTKNVENGQVTFTDLLPDSLYRIELTVDGLHKLVGKTSDIFTTDSMTNIVSISAITGAEDGSALVNFTVDGKDPEEWVITCTAEGEDEIVETFSGHSVTVKGLTVGKNYTLQLGTADGRELLGETSISFQATSMILAEELTIVSCNDGNMLVRWNTPKDAVVEGWTVRCYSDDGYEEFFEVTGTEVTFHNIDSNKAYTVEVTAAGMTQPNRVSLTANPITITAVNVSEGNEDQISVTWEHDADSPEGGWLLLYSLDGRKQTQSVVKCDGANAVIRPKIPGATYHFEIQAADATSIFENRHSYTCSNADVFEKHGFTADKVTAHMLKTPEQEDWTYESANAKAFYTDTFSVGDKLSVVLHADVSFFLPKEELEILFVIRDGEGNVMIDLISQASNNWNDFWYAGDYHIGELDIPVVPTNAGNYTLSIYFNGKAMTSTNFTITE